MNLLQAISGALTRALNLFKAGSGPSSQDSLEEKKVAYRKLREIYAAQIDKVTIRGLPSYEVHGREVVLVSDHNLEQAVNELLSERYLGFDTESRPTFKKGEKSHGISIIQLCSVTRCYLFQMRNISNNEPVARIIDHPQILKIGVGLRGDYRQLKSNFDFRPTALVDLAPLFKPFGRKNDAGSKQLVALVLNQKLRKSKKASTSNWAVERLSPAQIEYASDDAFSSVDVYLRLREEFSPYRSLLDREVAKSLDLQGM